MIRWVGIVVASVSALALAAPGTAGAAATTRVGQAPHPPAGAKRIGPLPAATQLQVTITLRPRDPAALAAYATAVSTPGSSVYRHYLTVAEFAARFAPTPAQVAAVASALRRQGLNPGPAAPNRLSIPLTATAAQLARALSTSFNSVQLPDGRHAFANTAAPAFPAETASLIQGVVGLDSLYQAHPLGLAAPRARMPRAAPRVVTGGPQPCSTAVTDAKNDGAYTADQLASAYELSSQYQAGNEGAGQTVALFELEPFSASDISSYQTCYGTSASVSTVTVDTGAGSGSGSGESALDIEDVIGLAPKATLQVYEGPNTNAGVLDTYSKIATDDVAKVTSTSWGLCESQEGSSDAASENTIFQEMATQGQSIFAAAGDSGSEDCGTTSLAVDDPASQPYVTGVGGTSLTTLGPPPTESVWNDQCSGGGCGGGGGVSSLWRMPSYQSGAKASLDVINAHSSSTPCAAISGSGDCREVPDVSADADPATGYLIFYRRKWSGIGGTSAAAPTWAAFTALVNASSTCGGTPIGFANPLLYEAAAASYSSAFNDITVGNNDITGTNGGLYPAGAGYDMASGLGSPRGAVLPGVLCAGAETSSIGTVTLPDSASMPTGIAVDPVNHIAYVAESKANAVAKITATNGTSFSGTASDIASSSLCAGSCPLPGLNFPDDLTLDSSQHLLASNFCVGVQTGVCSGEPSATTAAASQQTGTSSGQTDALAGCSYPSGEAVFTPSSGASRLFMACAGSGIVAECSPSGGGTPVCGSTAPSTVALTEPGGGSGQPVPSGVADDPTETATPAVIVADARNGTLSVISLSGSTLTAGAPVQLASSCEPAYVATGPAAGGTAAVYVACPGNGTIEVGTLSGTTLGTFTATALPTLGSSTPSPYGIAVNAAGTLLAVSDSANGDLVVYPALSGTSLNSPALVTVGSVPDGVAIDGSNVFVANEGSATVSVVDPGSASPQARGHVVPQHGPNRPVSHTPLVAPVASDG